MYKTTSNNTSSEGLSLQEHLALLGIDGNHLAFCCGIPPQVVQRALAGQEIVAPHAEAIAYELTQQHGLKHAVGFTPADIRGLKVHQPPAHVAADKPNPMAQKLGM